MLKHLLNSDAENYRDNPFREIAGPKFKTNFWGGKVFADGSSYSKDLFTGQVKIKKRFGLWGRLD
jgi:hypothetical protein